MCIILAAATPVFAAQMINVNVASAAVHPNNTAIQQDETFGVAELGTVSAGWNNLKWHKENLIWEDGTESTVGLTANFFETALNFFGAGYINTPLNYGAAHYAGTSDDPGTGFSFYNLSDNFPDGYYIIVYMSAFLTNEGALVSDGRTNFYYRPPADNKTPLTPEALIKATVTSDPGPGNYSEAHYAVFGSKEFPLRLSAFTVRVDLIAGGGAAICGAQIVSASDPVVKTDWAGYPIDEEGYIDTGAGFLGWLWVGEGAGLGNWLYSDTLGDYVYMEEGYVNLPSGSWVYTYQSEILDPDGIHENWFYSKTLKTWVASYGETTGSGSAWIYVIDSGN
jgi:hypothetical protein